MWLKIWVLKIVKNKYEEREREIGGERERIRNGRLVFFCFVSLLMIFCSCFDVKFFVIDIGFFIYIFLCLVICKNDCLVFWLYVLLR